MGSAATIPEFTFNHLDPDGTPHSYSSKQSKAIAATILKAPVGGKLKLPDFEDRFEICWGTEAKGRSFTSGILQRNITNGNKRSVEVSELDAWLELYEKALSEDKTARKPCRYWDKCHNHNPDHRLRFLHPEKVEEDKGLSEGTGGRKVQLVASELGGIRVATAYHTSVLVDGEEFSFSPSGISRARGPVSHQDASKPPQILESGVSQETGEQLFAALKNHFRPGTYDLLYKNCNSFSDLALYFLLQQRLSSKYKVLERAGRSLPSLVEKVSGGGYVPNEKATSFDASSVIQELDKLLESPPAICVTPGCDKPTWNRLPGERCSRGCGR